jgi:hypothetical protein
MMNSLTVLVATVVNYLVVEIARHLATHAPIKVNERSGEFDYSHCQAHCTYCQQPGFDAESGPETCYDGPDTHATKTR